MIRQVKYGQWGMMVYEMSPQVSKIIVLGYGLTRLTKYRKPSHTPDLMITGRETFVFDQTLSSTARRKLFSISYAQRLGPCHIFCDSLINTFKWILINLEGWSSTLPHSNRWISCSSRVCMKLDIERIEGLAGWPELRRMTYPDVSYICFACKKKQLATVIIRTKSSSEAMLHAHMQGWISLFFPSEAANNVK